MIESVELELEVIPNSAQFCVKGFNPWTNSLRVKVKGKALKGQTNKELAAELGKLLNAKVEIISGGKSRKKKVLVTGASREQINKALQP
ncbi:putative ACR, YggU family [uncultured archaeon]|nr:putative ACR, YggU family [uncultured archaeon]